MMGGVRVWRYTMPAGAGRGWGVGRQLSEPPAAIQHSTLTLHKPVHCQEAEQAVTQLHAPLAASRAMPSLRRQVSSALRAASRLAAMSTAVRLPLGQYSAGRRQGGGQVCVRAGV